MSSRIIADVAQLNLFIFVEFPPVSFSCTSIIELGAFGSERYSQYLVLHDFAVVTDIVQYRQRSTVLQLEYGNFVMDDINSRSYLG